MDRFRTSSVKGLKFHGTLNVSPTLSTKPSTLNLEKTPVNRPYAGTTQNLQMKFSLETLNRAFVGKMFLMAGRPSQ